MGWNQLQYLFMHKEHAWNNCQFYDKLVQKYQLHKIENINNTSVDCSAIINVLISEAINSEMISYLSFHLYLLSRIL